jgi:hypothetical protein
LEKAKEKIMGIDFYSCENCGHNFPDCGEYFSCSGCYAKFCSDECGGRQLHFSELDEDEDEESIEDDHTTCVLCRKETAIDHELLAFVLKHFKMTYDEALELYRKED